MSGTAEARRLSVVGRHVAAAADKPDIGAPHSAWGRARMEDEAGAFVIAALTPAPHTLSTSGLPVAPRLDWVVCRAVHSCPTRPPSHPHISTPASCGTCSEPRDVHRSLDVHMSTKLFCWISIEELKFDQRDQDPLSDQPHSSVVHSLAPPPPDPHPAAFRP